VLDYHGVIFGGEAWRCCLSFETLFSRQHLASLPVKKKNSYIAPLRETIGKVTFFTSQKWTTWTRPVVIFLQHKPFTKYPDQDG